MYSCCFEVEGKCLYNRNNFCTNRKFVKRFLCTVIHVEGWIQICSFFHKLPDQFCSLGYKARKSVSTSTIHLPSGKNSKRLGGFLFAGTGWGIFQSNFRKQNKMERVLSIDKTIAKWQQVLLLHPRQKAVILLCNNSGQAAISKWWSPPLPMVSNTSASNLAGPGNITYFEHTVPRIAKAANW